jgi:hypothetical protein
LRSCLDGFSPITVAKPPLFGTDPRGPKGPHKLSVSAIQWTMVGLALDVRKHAKVVRVKDRTITWMYVVSVVKGASRPT